jgi:hypothetical protein
MWGKESKKDRLRNIEEGIIILMATIDELKVDVEAQTEVINSAVVLLNGLSAQLAAAIASNDPAKVQAVKDELDANTAALAAAVAANTVAPTPTV